MSEPLSAATLTAIGERVNAATAGPWEFGLDPMEVLVSYQVVDDDDLIASELIEENAVFISHARTDVPLLLAEVHRLRNLIGEALKEWPGGDYLTAKPHKALDVAIYMHEALTEQNGERENELATI